MQLVHTSEPHLIDRLVVLHKCLQESNVRDYKNLLTIRQSHMIISQKLGNKQTQALNKEMGQKKRNIQKTGTCT